MFACSERVAFYIGSYPVMKYGITMGIAIAVSIFILLKIRAKFYEQISEDTIVDLSFWVVIAGIIGARLWYVLLNLSYYSNHIIEAFMINRGGISIQGAIMGGVIAGIFYTKFHKLDFLKISDMYALILPIGQAIGRWGNFFNSEAFGRPCDLPWKLYIPLSNRPDNFLNVEYFHPTFLYESIADILIFFILFFVLKKYTQNRSGVIFFTYLILYSVVRFFIESIRIDSVLNVLTVPIASIVSCVFFLAGIVGLIYVLNKNN